MAGPDGPGSGIPRLSSRGPAMERRRVFPAPINSYETWSLHHASGPQNSPVHCYGCCSGKCAKKGGHETLPPPLIVLRRWYWCQCVVTTVCGLADERLRLRSRSGAFRRSTRRNPITANLFAPSFSCVCHASEGGPFEGAILSGVTHRLVMVLVMCVMARCSSTDVRASPKC